MIDTPQIVQTEARIAAVIHFNIPRADIRQVMEPGFSELFSVLANHGVAPTGPTFAHHHRLDAARFDFDLGVGVSAPVAATGRVKPGELPACIVARTVHRGPYEGLPAAWAEFEAWITAYGRQPGGQVWECYITNPNDDPNPVAWRTELNWPLVA